jgi:two-component system cell cycle response regulator
MIFDIDHFKSVNDTYGHLVGDKVLKTLAKRVTAAVRQYDLFGRYGGEEFILYISDISPADMREHAERIRLALSTKPMEFEEATLTITASFGVASVLSAPDLDGIIKLADTALYEAKHSGRNCVRFTQETEESE